MTFKENMIYFKGTTYSTNEKWFQNPIANKFYIPYAPLLRKHGANKMIMFEAVYGKMPISDLVKLGLSKV